MRPVEYNLINQKHPLLMCNVQSKKKNGETNRTVNGESEDHLKYDPYNRNAIEKCTAL
jgi:hypothetical protein